MDKDFEQIFRRHFNLAPLPYQSLDEKGKIISVNPAWLEFFNYEENEVIGKSFSHFLTSVSAKAFNESFPLFISKGFAKNVSLQAANKDGKILPISLNGNIIKNKRGAFHSFQSVLIKVEKQKEIISNINSIIDASIEPIWAIDRDYKFLFFNDRFKEAFNNVFEIELKKGISAINIIDDEKQISFWKEKYEAVFSGKPRKFLYAFKSESKTKYSEITLSPIVEDNAVVAVFAISVDITEKRKTDQKINEQKIWHETVFEESKDAIFISSEDANFCMVNKAATQLTGYSKEELLKMSIPDLHETNDLTAYNNFFGRILSGEEIISEAKILRKDGSKVETEFSNKPIEIGDKIFMHTIARDISERKYFEGQLEKSLNDYKTVFDNSSDAILIFEPENETIFDVNKTAKKIYGFSYNEFVGMDLRKISKTPERGKEVVKQALKTGIIENFISTHFNKKGVEIVFQISGFLTNFKGRKAIISFNHDITELVKVKNALEESEKLFRDIFNNSADAIIISEVISGKYAHVNRKFFELTGFSEDEVIGKTSVELGIFESAENRKKLIEIFKKENGLKDHLIKLKVKSGKIINVVVTSGIIKIKGEKFFLNTAKDITDVMTLKNALAETEKLYETLFEKLADPVALHNMKGEIIDCNLSFSRHLGYSKKELKGKKPEFFSHAETANRTHSCIAELNQRGEVLFETIHLTKDGREIPVEVLARKIQYKGVDTILAVNRDISERKETISKLEESENLFRKVFNNSMDSITISEIDTGEYIQVNKGFSEILGFSEEEAIGKTSAELGIWLNENDRKTFLRKFLEKNSLREYILKMRTKRGEIKTALISSEFISLGGKNYFLNTGKDITRLVETRKALAETEKLYETLFELSPSGIVLSDIDGNIIGVNQNYCDMFQCSREELIGKNISSINESETPEQITANLQKIVSTKHYQHEVVNIKKNGEKFYLSLRERLIALPSGKKGILSIAIDITERKKYETEIQKSRRELKRLTSHLQNVREKERGEIARKIHDALGQSLTAVQFETAWLQKRLQGDKIIAERLSRLKSSVDEMIVEVQNISTELRPGILDELGLALAAEWYCEQFEQKSGIKIHKKIDYEKLLVDNKISIHIFRMLQECLTNVGRHSQATRAAIELIEKNHSLYLSIRDNGIGIDKEKIYDSKSLGLLGLKERVFSLHGKIDILSAPGKGTKIKIVIPLSQNNEGLI